MTNSRLVRGPLTIVVLFLLVIVSPTHTLGKNANTNVQKVESSVVKIIVHSNPPDLLSPWQKSGIEASSGSGVIIDGQRILTSAHVIEDSVSIEVKRAGMSERYTATVEYVGNDCDLALLTVEDDRFFDDAQPLRVGDMPGVQEEVQVYGFPVGGETISVTSGIVSRVEVSTYLHSMEDLLLAQVDASINPGNSGGPVIASGTVVGIAVQSLEEAENVGYMIPVPVITHFLNDVMDGEYDGFPRLGVDFQNLESPAIRASLGMKDQQTGALVSRMDYGSPPDGVLRTGDVVLSIGGLAVANDVTVNRPPVGRVHLSEVFQNKQIGDTLSLSVLRDGKTIAAELELKPHQFLVPGRRAEEGPDYLVFGGLVFQPLTIDYLIYFEDIPADLGNLTFVQNSVTKGRNQVILIQKVLPHEVNRGYQDWADDVVETVNGVTLHDMAHLAHMIDNAEGEWLKIVTADGSYLTLSISEARSAQEAILRNFGIAQDRSPRLVRPTLTTQAKNE